MANTTIEITLLDDRKVKATLNFGKLYLLQNKNKEAYDAYQNVMKGKTQQDAFSIVRIIYTAYLCGNLDSYDVMTWEDFLNVAPVNNYDLKEIYEKLTPKKN